MSKKHIVKLSCVLVMLLLPTFSPWWVVLGAMVISLFLFDSFYGVIAAGFLMDMFYGNPSSYALFMPFFIISLVLVFLVPILKRRMVFWQHARF